MQKAGSLVPRTLICLQDVHSAQEVLVLTDWGVTGELAGLFGTSYNKGEDDDDHYSSHKKKVYEYYVAGAGHLGLQLLFYI